MTELYWCSRCESHRVTMPAQLCPVCEDKPDAQVDESRAIPPPLSWIFRRLFA